jgi:magnesium chelatase accessory protein
MMANWNLDPLVKDLPRLNTKLLLIAADKDRSISPRVAQRVRDLVPGSVLEMMQGVGHLAHEERPEDMARAIISFAAQTNMADENAGASVN